MVLAVFAMLVSLATGWAALVCVWPRGRDGGGDLVLRSTIAIGIGFFLNSVIYLFCLALHVAERPWVISLDLAGLAGLAYVARRVRRRAKLLDANEGDLELNAPAGNFEWVLGSGLVVALLANAKVWHAQIRAEPLGYWDAIAIWNLKARFFVLESGEHWRRAFSDTISWSHTDYPLLLPLNVARLWTYGANTDPEIPALLSLLFTLLVVAVIFGAAIAMRGRAMAYLAAFALLATPAFMSQASWQTADIPLSYFLVTSLALVILSHRSFGVASGVLVAAGLSAGAAAWTKNEGLLFALAIPLALALTDGGRGFSQRLKRALEFTKGLALPLALLFVMKLGAGGENDLVRDFTMGSLERLIDPSRHLEIVASFGRKLLTLTGPGLLVVIVGLCIWWSLTRRRRANVSIIPAALALTLQLSGYYVIYLITERDLEWHLATSNLRLFVQLWPSLLLLLFVGMPSFVGAAESATPDEPTLGSP